MVVPSVTYQRLHNHLIPKRYSKLVTGDGRRCTKLKRIVCARKDERQLLDVQRRDTIFSRGRRVTREQYFEAIYYFRELIYSVRAFQSHPSGARRSIRRPKFDITMFDRRVRDCTHNSRFFRLHLHTLLHKLRYVTENKKSANVFPRDNNLLLLTADACDDYIACDHLRSPYPLAAFY